MLAPLKQVGKKYKTLIAKMLIDSDFMEITKADLVNMCDIGLVMYVGIC
jgi:Ni2+-binding GTPase involved in maturation of urease and hydrogenase